MAKIAIIGAGPGGLCVANILQKNNIDFTLFEGDKSPHERNQGGTLDLHPDEGQLAMKEAGLWDEFLANSRPEADVMKIVELSGEVLWDGNGPDKHEKPEQYRRPEIDREKLKDILFQNVRPENLRFGAHLQSVTATPSGKYDLHFREGPVESDYDVVIGAEGAWSKVRKILTDEMPHYAGISTLELWLEDADAHNPWVSDFVGAGSCFCFGEGRAIQMQRLGNNTIRTYASLRKPESFFKDSGLDFESNTAEAHKQFVATYWGDVSPDLQRCLLESNSQVVPRTLYMLPIGFKWQAKPRITLLGDAAHLMTPFAGVGVNAAFADALDLARVIVKAASTAPDDISVLTAAIEAYEARMFPRGEKFAKKTYQGLQSHFSAEGSKGFAKRHHDMFAEAK